MTLRWGIFSNAIILSLGKVLFIKNFSANRKLKSDLCVKSTIIGDKEKKEKKEDPSYRRKKEEKSTKNNSKLNSGKSVDSSFKRNFIKTPQNKPNISLKNPVVNKVSSVTPAIRKNTYNSSFSSSTKKPIKSTNTISNVKPSNKNQVLKYNRDSTVESSFNNDANKEKEKDVDKLSINLNISSNTNKKEIRPSTTSNKTVGTLNGLKFSRNTMTITPESALKSKLFNSMDVKKEFKSGKASRKLTTSSLNSGKK